MIRKMVPVKIIVHYPESKEGKAELARRVAQVHADTVNRRLKELNCPAQQKLELLDTVIKNARQ